MLKGLMIYNAPLEMSANKRQWDKAERKVSGCPQGEDVDFANFEKNILKKYLKVASKYYIIYIEKRKKKQNMESEPLNRMPHRF
jgi:hypothetical protein